MRSCSLAMALTLALSGCSALSALGGGPTRDVFELLPQSGAPQQCTRTRIAELVVELPKARSALDSDRIMVRPSELQTQYLPDAQWGDTVPVTLQTLLVNSFANYDAFAYVGRTPLGSSGDFALISEIHDFNAVTSGQGAVVRLAVDAQMVRESDARIVSRGRFVAEVAAPTTRTADLVAAFDTAARDLVDRMTDWGLRAARVDPASCR